MLLMLPMLLLMLFGSDSFSRIGMEENACWNCDCNRRNGRTGQIDIASSTNEFFTCTRDWEKRFDFLPLRRVKLLLFMLVHQPF